METEDVEGVIISLVEDKGYGFISVPGYDRNVFFHAKDIQGIRFEQLRKGDRVNISQIVQKEKGNSARNVSLITVS